MLEINGARQLSLAVAHLVYGVPMDQVALMSWAKLMLYSYGELKIETSAIVELVHEKKTKLKAEYVIRTLMYQGDKKLMRFEGKLIMMQPALAAKMRDMSIGRDHPELDDAPHFTW
jgi:hypothetical protein